VRIAAIFSRLRLRLPWGRIKPSASGETGVDFQSVYDKNSDLAERFAFLILVGLAVEIVAVFVLKKPWLEGSFTIASTTLILVGVWGELRYEKRAKEAGDSIVSLAKASAAESNRLALEAQLALEALRTPRQRRLTTDVLQSITSRLKAFPGINFDVGDDWRDREALDFIWDLLPALSAGGWTHIDWIGGNGSRKLNWTGDRDRIYGFAGVINVSLEMSPEMRPRLLPAAEALAEELRKAGVDVSTDQQ
jgi:hypothetical protein